MSMTIMITDSRGLSSFVRIGAAPQGNEAAVVSAAELKVWSTKAMTFRALRRLTRRADEPDIAFTVKDLKKVHPFGAESGDCLFEERARLCFSPADSNELMVVLSNFPVGLAARRSGKGRVIAGKRRGSLVPGEIDWEIIAVNEGIAGRVQQL
jgi:hypothetical protein